MSNPFKNVDKFIKGRQTSRLLRNDGQPSPPSNYGDFLQNQAGAIALGAVSITDPQIPVDSDERPTLYPFTLDTNGRLRVIFDNTPAVSVSIGPSTGTATVTVIGTVTVTGTVTATLVGTPTVTASLIGTPTVTATLIGTPTVTVSGVVSVSSSRIATYHACGTANISITGGLPFAVLQNPSASTKTLIVRKVYVTLSTSGTAGATLLQMVLGTSLSSTTGSSINLTPIRHDSNDPVSAAFNNVFIYETNTVTPGAGNLGVWLERINNGAVNLNPPSKVLATWSDISDDKGIVLHPGQELQVILVALITTQTVSITFEWTEQ